MSGSARSRKRNQRVGRDVERRLKPSRVVFENGASRSSRLRERGAVHDEVEPAEFLIDLGEHRLDVGVRRDVARQDERGRVEPLRQLVDVFFESSLVGEREARAAPGGGLRDGPRRSNVCWRRRR